MVKIKRSFPAPASLSIEAKKATGSYEKPDVVEQLRRDFHDKCYICELKYLQDPQVEHLLPHKNGKYPDRKFDWNNLFWVCSHCNSVKNQSKYAVGILDCCHINPEEHLLFRLINGEVQVYAINESDQTAVLTASLIHEVFCITNTGMRVYRSDMRLKELCREMNLLYDNLEALKSSPESKVVHRKLKALLRRESAFAAFKRGYIRENKKYFPQLLSYIQ